MIEQALILFHQQPKSEIQQQLEQVQQQNIGNDHNTQSKIVHNEEKKIPNKPFATIDQVFYGSPAENCGMKVGDKILQIGDISYTNFKQLQDVGKLIQNNKDKEVSLIIVRDENVLNLVLVPKKWEGVGLLGCHLIPI